MFILFNGNKLPITTLAECEAAGQVLDKLGIYAVRLYDANGDTGLLVYSTSAREERAIQVED